MDRLRQLEFQTTEVSPRFRLIDLFAGAGGMTLGFSDKYAHEQGFQHRFEPVWANDLNGAAVATYNANFGAHCIQDDIIKLLKNPDIRIPAADVVIGGPPCQGFSPLNRKRNDDSRKQLWRPFLDVVERSQARVFVMENVPQLLKSPEYEEIVSVAHHHHGFHVASIKVLAADYGVPQLRWRAFIVGCRFTDPITVVPPKKTHFNPIKRRPGFFDESYIDNPNPWRNVADALGDLPLTPSGTEIRLDIEPPLDLHFGRSPTRKSLDRYRAIPDEGMNRFDLQRRAPELNLPCWIRKETGGTDLFGRLWWNRPALTIRTEFFKPEKGRYLHPSEHRPITHREAARLQSFPDWFRFYGSKSDVAKQIGNAVPPLLAAHIAQCVYGLLVSREQLNHARQVYAGTAEYDYVSGGGS